MAEFGDHLLALLVVRGLAGGLAVLVVLQLAAVLERLGDFRRHVVLVVLGQHFIGHQHAVAAQLAEGDDALPLAEQVGKDAMVGDGHFLGAVGDHETHVQRILAALQRTLFHQAAGAYAGVGRRFAVGDLGRGVEQVDVLLQGRQRQTHRGADAHHDGEDDDQTFLADRIHCWASRRRRRASSCR
ncbi:Uncharacterised protein [Acinetobacter baumannii]|nr:Uncharacterised protein [Acinetobacter baumannii]